MKKIFFICLIFISFVAMAQEDKLVWDYPVKPGTEEWMSLKSNEEKVKVCQIPEKILPVLSTDELTEMKCLTNL